MMNSTSSAPVTIRLSWVFSSELTSPEALSNGLPSLLALALGCVAVDGISFWISSLLALLIDGVSKLFGVLALFAPDAGATVIERAGIVAYSVCWVSVLNQGIVISGKTKLPGCVGMIASDVWRCEIKLWSFSTVVVLDWSGYSLKFGG